MHQRQQHQGQCSQGLFDDERVEIVVPPAAPLPFASQIRVHLDFEVALLDIDPQQIVLRQGNTHRSQQGTGETVSRWLVTSLLHATESLTYERIIAEAFS